MAISVTVQFSFFFTADGIKPTGYQIKLVSSYKTLITVLLGNNWTSSTPRSAVSLLLCSSFFYHAEHLLFFYRNTDGVKDKLEDTMCICVCVHLINRTISRQGSSTGAETGGHCMLMCPWTKHLSDRVTHCTQLQRAVSSKCWSQDQINKDDDDEGKCCQS